MSWERSERGWGELTQWVRVIFEFRREGTITWRYHEPQRERELDGEDSAWSREREKGEKKEGQWQWGYVRKLQEWLSVREYILKGLEFYFLFSIIFLENFEEKRKLRRNLSIYIVIYFIFLFSFFLS